ncbi:MAG TPA: DUF2785 domain-containing protein [Steroidobacteraceae bacterium]
MRVRTDRRAAAAPHGVSAFLLAGLLMVFGGARSEAQSTAHDRAFWSGLRSAGFRLPQSQSALPLALEAASLLASTDPELRDDIAYEAIETWVYREQRLNAAELSQLRATLSANARRGLGEAPGDGLFLRSFSTLSLAVLAAEDLKRPFLDSQQFDGLVDLGIEELGSERDLRGYVSGKGWGHATAHCADLMKFLARSHWLRPQQQSQMTNAIAERLRSAGEVFVWGEDARLAAALTAIAGRSDADPAPFLAWFKRLTAEHAALWSGPFDPVRYVPVRAQLNTLAAFGADLEATKGPQAGIRVALRSLRAEAQ